MPAPTSDRGFARVRRETADAVVDLVVDARGDGTAADAVLAVSAGAERAAAVLDGILSALPLSGAPAFAIVEWPSAGADALARVTVHGALLAIALPAGPGSPVLVDGAASRSLVEHELPGAGEVLVAPRAGGTALVRLRRGGVGGAEAAIGDAAAVEVEDEDDGVCADTIVPFTMHADADADAADSAIDGRADAAGEQDAGAEAALEASSDDPDPVAEETIVPPAVEEAAPASAPSAPPIGLFAPTQLLGAIQGLLVDPARPERPLDELSGAVGASAAGIAATAEPGAIATEHDEHDDAGAAERGGTSASGRAGTSPLPVPAPASGRLVDPEAPTEVLDATIVGGIVQDLRASARAATGTGETTADGTSDRTLGPSSPFPSEPPAGSPFAPLPGDPRSAPASADPDLDPAPAPVIEQAASVDRFTVIGPDGRPHEITGAAIFGRAPRAVFSASDTTLVEITDAVDISRNHVRIASEAGVIVVTDLHSRNGTDVVMPGRAPQRLRGGEPVPILEGTVIDLGSGVRLTVRR